MTQWFQIKEVAQDVYIIEEPGHVQSYLINGRTHSALVDTGAGLSNIREAIQILMRGKVIVLNTHWHFDHIGGNTLFDDVGISEKEKHLVEMDLANRFLMDLYIRPCLEEGIPLPSDFVPEEYGIKGSKPTLLIRDGDQFDIGGRTIQAISTPGHTHGSMSFFDNLTGSLFCGDLLYQGTLYAHFDDSDLNTYHQSLKKLLDSNHSFKTLLPGHNTYPLGPEFINQVHQGFGKILDGDIPAEINEDWGEPSRSHVFDDFAVLSKVPGARGVRLFDFG
ncbi:MBL fold metallo-hydrolase [Thermodesulfobacteriota bacterium]